MVLILGASGTLGKLLTQQFIQAGQAIKAGTRNPEKLSHLACPIVHADIRETASLQHAIKDIDCVITSVHGLAPPTRDNHAGIVDAQGMNALIDLAVQAKLKRFVFISTTEASPDSSARFHQIKYQIEEKLRNSGLSYTIIRAPAFMEVHALLLMAEPLMAGKPVRFIGKADTPIGWISAQDVAKVISSTLQDNSKESSTIELVPNQTMSRLEALKIVEEICQKKANTQHIPVAMAKVLGNIARIFNPGLSYLFETVLADGEKPKGIDNAQIHIEGQYTLQDICRDWLKARAS